MPQKLTTTTCFIQQESWMKQADLPPIYIYVLNSNNVGVIKNSIDFRLAVFPRLVQFHRNTISTNIFKNKLIILLLEF